jgi:hypothetical protein
VTYLLCELYQILRGRDIAKDSVRYSDPPLLSQTILQCPQRASPIVLPSTTVSGSSSNDHAVLTLFRYSSQMVVRFTLNFLANKVPISLMALKSLCLAQPLCYPIFQYHSYLRPLIAFLHGAWTSSASGLSGGLFHIRTHEQLSIH